MANNIYFEADVEFLKNPMQALVVKGEKQLCMLLQPEDFDNPQSVGIAELIQKLGSDGDSITKTLDIQDQLGDLKIQLSTAYMKYLSAIEGDPTSKSEVEYALKFQILDISSISIFNKIKDIIDIKTITVAAWNTTNTEITDKMKLSIPDFSNPQTQALPQS